MSYVVLARKYRPMGFEDLVGQDHVARTLANAIAAKRVAHAFLFTGVRGVGKTTSARILAKALNCMGATGATQGEDPGPTATPCLRCPACREIADGTDMDVREIDGASYTGVDDVRKLQDSLPYRPSRDRFKIIIVDEVHMLSVNAWNAFLKTLEEPPSHVKFIFATTEAHKVPVTILSRVQRFDFKLIPARLIMTRLRQVLAAENLRSDDAALSLISREAAGSMRDAMSLLDQVIAWGGEELTGEDVAQVLGVASRRVLHDLGRALVQGDAAQCLSIIEQVVGQGRDIGHVSRELLALLRDLVVGKVCKDPGNLLDLPDEEQAEVKQLASSTDADDLLRLHQGFSHGLDEVLRSAQARAALEMLLVRLARRPPLLPLEEFVTRLGSLERRLGGATSGGGPGRPGGSEGRANPTAPPPAPPARAQGLHSERAAPAPSPPPHGSEGRPQPSPPTETPQSLEARARPVAPATVPPAQAAVGASARPAVPMRGASSPSPILATEEPAPPRTPAPSSHAAPSWQAAGADQAPEPPGCSSSRAPLSEELHQAWRQIVDRVAAQRPDVAAILEHAAPLSVTGDQLVLGWEPHSVFAQALSPEEARIQLLSATRLHFGREASVVFEHDSSRAEKLDTLAAISAREREQARRRAAEALRSHPRVKDVEQILGARIREIRLPSN